MVRKKVGLIINPIAGIGGKAGLKGSDGEEIQRQAIQKGIKPESPHKATVALKVLENIKDSIEILTYECLMGEREAENLGFDVTVIGAPLNPDKTCPEDTENAAKDMLENNVDIILFAGGDGTARNIYKATGDKVPVIGIPAGVKIHSGVYAITPKSAGHVAKQFLLNETSKLKEAEVVDLDENLYRQEIISPKLYGYMIIPDDEKKMQHRKSRSTSLATSLDFIATDVIKSMEQDVIYVIGAGSTTRNIMILLGLPYTLIGVDVICNKEIVKTDVDEQELWDIIRGKPTKLILTAIGGQGHIFGRGNQQISPRVIKEVGKENINIIATKEKLLSLHDRRLLTDTGDDELDKELSGHIKVITGLDERTICAVGAEN